MKYPESTMPGIDIIIPDYTYLIKNKDRVRGYIVTHGHDDCMGSITYACKDVPAPIYCSKVTSEMIKDTAKRYRQNVKLDFLMQGLMQNEKSVRKQYRCSLSESQENADVLREMQKSSV